MSRLLIVDDEPHVVAALTRVLRRGLPKSVVVEGFDDPSLALRRMQTKVFSAIISDFRMPQMNGLAFLRQARAVQPGALRLMLSASTEVETITKAVNDVEVFRYLVKPWDDEELLQHVRMALEKAQSFKHDQELADQMRILRGDLSAQDAERKRLEAEEPGITHVEWGPLGEVLMPDIDAPIDEHIVWTGTTSAK